MKSEVWVDVLGYNGRYQVSDWGNIRSLNWRNSGAVKQLSPVSDKDGYQIVCLSSEKFQKNVRLHRLIAEVFIPNPNKKPHINHKNEDKKNNRVDNLEWVTEIENNNHGTRNKRIAKLKRNNTYNCKPVSQYTIEGEFLKTWPSLSEPKRALGYDDSHIARCCRGIKKTAYGYKWKFTPEYPPKVGDAID